MVDWCKTLHDVAYWFYDLANTSAVEGITALIVIVIMGWILNWYYGGPRDIPPGPRGLPVLGYLPFLGKKPYETLTSLASRYNCSVFSMYLGNKLVIVLNDYRAVKAAFVDQAENFAGRPAMSNMNVKSNDNQSLSTKEGKYWKSHRNLVLTALKNQSIEDRVTNEIARLVELLRSQRHGVVDIRDLIETSVMSNICGFALGRHFEYDDPVFERIRQDAKRLMEAASSVAVATFLPWTRFVPGMTVSSKDRGKILGKLYGELESEIEKKKLSVVLERGGDYVEAYRTKQKESPEDQDFSETGLLHNMRLLMTAGTEPTANALQWCLVHLMARPDVQRKVQEEIDQVIGSDRSPSWSDLPRTPYTEATICEILRLASLMPISLLHSNKEECVLLGYKIPKRCYVMANFWNVHHDSNFWEDPHTLIPERFLSEDRTSVNRPANFVPFSTGKRQCVGERLARMELYLYITTMLQNFTFKTPDNCEPSLEPIIGLHLVPKKVEAIIVHRT